jgi:signal transduction histidine kinase
LQAESGRSFTEDDCAMIEELDAGRRSRSTTHAFTRSAKPRGARRNAPTVPRTSSWGSSATSCATARAHRDGARNHGALARRYRGAQRRIIERQVLHLTRLVDDLLDVSRITQGKIALRRDHVDLRDVIARAIELTRPMFERRTRSLGGRGRRRRASCRATRCASRRPSRTCSSTPPSSRRTRAPSACG